MYYFAYGSNMSLNRIRERGVSFTSREHAMLTGYTIMFNKASPKNPSIGLANIVRTDESTTVHGILYKVTGDEDITKLDRFEGYPTHYGRGTVNVVIDTGETREAIVYVAQPEYIREGLLPTPKYLGLLLDGSDLLPQEYVEELKQIPTYAIESEIKFPYKEH